MVTHRSWQRSSLFRLSKEQNTSLLALQYLVGMEVVADRSCHFFDDLEHEMIADQAQSWELRNLLYSLMIPGNNRDGNTYRDIGA